MAFFARTYFTGDGVTTDYTLSFSYLSQDHIKVYLDGVLTTEWTWLTPTSIRLNSAPSNGVVVLFKRSTSPAARIVNYTVPSSFNADELNTDSIQQLYLSQEALDAEEVLLADDPATGQWDAKNRRIVNAADPINPQDVATKLWTETGLTSQLTLAENAKTAAQAAQAAAELAQAAAELARNAAQTAETNAETAETGAVTARTAAQAAQAAAEAAQLAAETAATNAASSATAASGSAMSATSSATAAAADALAADTARIAAQAAQSAAVAAQAAAEAAQTAAELAETNAAASAAAAASSEAGVDADRVAAETAAAGAATSETNAATSASLADADRIAAQAAQAAAETARDQAQTAQAAAELAETNAETAEANAAASATAAEVAKIEWQGVWSGVTAYAVNDAVENNGTSYICTVAHTNQQPPNASFWDVLAEKGEQGAAGSGSGDMLAANNLSDVVNASTARTNLGLAIGTDVQAADINLDQLASLVLVADRVVYADGANSLALSVLTAAGRALIDDVDVAAQRTTLGLGTSATSNSTTSTLDPSGGSDDDTWYKVAA